MEVQDNLISRLNNELNISLPISLSGGMILSELAFIINNLINSDFQRLVFILYRLDINESRLKKILDINMGKDAAIIISKLIIERELQKISTRKEYSKRDDFNKEEKW